MINKRWTLNDANETHVAQLQEQLGINKIFCELLVHRGITNFDEAKAFFRMNEEQLHDPFLMKDMEKAINRIQEAMKKGEHILFYGDYDVDGTTSVALVYSFFQHIYDRIGYYIPNRFSEGYGISEQGIEFAREHNFSLIITLDCGIKSIDLIAKANEYGIDTIITDHHLPGNKLPDAHAILNAKQSDCSYPYKELCGCGVGYKLIAAFGKKENIDREIINEHLDLLATAIAADIVPITDENRTLAFLGLQKANENPCVPITALKDVGELKRKLSIRDLVFIIGPRVNAAGRMTEASKAVKLFIEKDKHKARNMAHELDADNSERVQIDRSITKQAIDMLEAESDKKSTVVYNKDWHKGVVGIVASRLIDKAYRPTIVLTESNGMITGSARSIKGFNMFEGLSACEDLLENFGGHFFAAGLTLKEENLPAFKERFDKIVSETLSPDQFIPELNIDSKIELKQLNMRFLKTLEEFAPHGPENLAPIFWASAVQNFEGRCSIVKDKHIRFVVKQENSPVINGIGFNLADKMNLITDKESFDLAFHIERNVWRDRENIQLKVLDLK